MTRRRATYLSYDERFNLDVACRPLTQAGLHVYLVGSCLHRADYRDVDLRAIMVDEEYDFTFAGYPGRAKLLGIALSEWLTARTGLPIDFQFQRMTDANAEFDGERNAVGMDVT